MNYLKMNYQELEKHLFEICDKKFADFSKSLSNSDYISIGVKNPVLRQIIKEHIKDERLKLEDFKLGKYLEIDFIYYGLALSRLSDIDAQLNFLRENIKYAKSWAITDTLSTYLKKCSFEKYWEFFLSMYKSKYTYERRLAYVFGLKHYKDERILKVLNHINLNEEYMVMMSEAWLLATVAIVCPNEVFDFLKDISDITLTRKTISKICDSYRFIDKTKEKFKSLR